MLEVIATNLQINQRLEEMAAIIIKTYANTNPLFVCLLRGGTPFASKLLFATTRQSPSFHPELDYMTLKTYSNRLESKPPKLIMDLAPDTHIEGRTVIVLDDVLDEGQTAEFVSQHLLKKGAIQVDLIVLVQKRKQRHMYKEARLVGFEAPDEWIVGMGMDDPRISKEAYRWADYLGFTQKD